MTQTALPRLFAGVLLALFLFVPSLAFAQTSGLGLPEMDRIVPQCTGDYLIGSSGERACTICDFLALAQNLLNFAIFLAVVTAGALFAWAGWLYATRAMNTANVQKANKIFVNVFIGLVLVMGAYVIVDTLMKMLAGGSFLSNWGELCPQQQFAEQGRGTGRAR